MFWYFGFIFILVFLLDFIMVNVFGLVWIGFWVDFEISGILFVVFMILL